MRTVRDFMESMGYDEAQASTTEKEKTLVDFWSRLCDLGWKLATKTPEETMDVYAFAPIPDEKWAELKAEWAELKAAP